MGGKGRRENEDRERVCQKGYTGGEGTGVDEELYKRVIHWGS